MIVKYNKISKSNIKYFHNINYLIYLISKIKFLNNNKIKSLTLLIEGVWLSGKQLGTT